MKMFIVRHGEDTDNAAHLLNGHRDNDLTERGIQQAHETAQLLRSRGIGHILSSPLQRAYQTARIIATHLSIVGVTIDHRLIERDYGPLTGRPTADLTTCGATIIRHQDTTYPVQIPGAENYPAILKRVQAFVDEMRATFPKGIILVVTHAATGRTLRAAYNGWPLEKIFENPRFDNGEVIELS